LWAEAPGAEEIGRTASGEHVRLAPSACSQHRPISHQVAMIRARDSWDIANRGAASFFNFT